MDKIGWLNEECRRAEANLAAFYDNSSRFPTTFSTQGLRDGAELLRKRLRIIEGEIARRDQYDG